MEVNKTISGKSSIFHHGSTLMEQPQQSTDYTKECLRGVLEESMFVLIQHSYTHTQARVHACMHICAHIHTHARTCAHTHYS